MTEALQQMKLVTRPWHDVGSPWAIAPALFLLAALLFAQGHYFGSFVFAFAAFQAALLLNLPLNVGRPLAQEALDALLEDIASAVRTELYTLDHNPLREEGKLSIRIERAGRYQTPKITAAVEVPHQQHWIGVSDIAQDIIKRRISRRKLAATSYWLRKRTHEVVLQAPTHHDRIEALSSRTS